MHPIDHYATIRRGQEELLRRADYERMVRKAIRNNRRTNQKTYQRFVNWLGCHMVNWGQKLEQFGTSRKLQPTASLHQEH